MRLLVVGKLSDHKLRSKVLPLLGVDGVEEVGVVRTTPLPLEGVRSFCPPAIVRVLWPLAELWRLFTVLRLSAGPWRDAVLVAFYLIPHGIYIELARRLFGVRTVQVTLSQSDVELGIRHRFLRRALRRAEAVGVRGPISAQMLKEGGIAGERLFDPPNVYDPADYPPRDGEPDIDVLFVGNLVEVKRVDVLLRAVRILVDRGRPVRLTLVGDGVLRGRLERLARDLSLEGEVTFAGRRPADEVPSWLRRARVFVLTSEAEGLPMAMIEAMSCGVPVVVPDVGDVRTVARDGENALVVTPPTAEKYAEAIGRLLDDAALHGRLQEGCLRMRKSFERDYSLAAATEAWRRALRLAARTETLRA